MKRIIDLSLTLQSGMHGVEFEQKYTVADKGWNAKTLHLYSHAGTHVDAPVHFEATPKSIDEIPLGNFLVNAWVVHLTPIPPKSFITVDMVKKFVPLLSSGDGILLHTGWDKFYGKEEYRNSLPKISAELAEWLVGEKVALIGIDTPAVADPNNIEEITHIHQILLSADIVIVEGLTNMEAIQNSSVLFMALPLKIKDGDGSPVRAIAIEDR